mmetsp:Transcript_11942/g.15481  ORF Transcript_11942/g.15481 Transcript_11942/m.15481 type:complete len:359 (-) Transcript_11942:134-1210(-)
MSEISAGIGFLCSALAVIFFGICFTPVKNVETRDGIFFQWTVCLGIFVTGIIVGSIEGFHFFSVATAFGGTLWTTGNLLTVPIIQKLGIGLGTLLWGMTNMLMGWAAGSFGLFGLKKNDISSPALNYIGVILALVSLYIYLLVKPQEAEHSPLDIIEDQDEPLMAFLASPLATNGKGEANITRLNNNVQVQESLIPKAKLPSKYQWLVGVVMALVGGLFFGCSLIPMQHTIDHGGNDVPLNYVFSLFTGIFCASTAYLLVYIGSSQFREKDAFVGRHLILPGLAAGVMWGVADACWLVANEALGFSIAFPIITTGPGFLALLLGIFWFKEIRGKRNYIYITLAFVTTTVAVVCIGRSR